MIYRLSFVVLVLAALGACMPPYVIDRAFTHCAETCGARGVVRSTTPPAAGCGAGECVCGNVPTAVPALEQSTELMPGEEP